MDFTVTLGQLQALTGAELIGDPNVVITAIKHPAKATASTDLALILDKGILPLIQEQNLQLQNAIVPSDIDMPDIPNQLKVPRPKVMLGMLLGHVTPPPAIMTGEHGIHPTAVIHESAVIAEGAQIGPCCVIGERATIGKGTRLVSQVTIGADAQVGEDSLLYAGVRIGDRVRVGSRVILHGNAVIGADGFSFVTPEESSMESAQKRKEITSTNDVIIKVHSAGTVIIEDDVEIGANSCVDRATLGETIVGKNTKIDNLVQIGHNAQLGQNVLIAGQSGVAGSAKIGDRVVIAGSAGIRDNISIGDDAIVMPMSGVSTNVTAKTIVVGAPAIPIKDFMYREMQIKRLTRGYTRQMTELKDRLAALEAQLLTQTDAQLGVATGVQSAAQSEEAPEPVESV